MTETATLYGPVANDIPLVGRRLRDLANGHHPLLGEALEYVFETRGKRIRPALVLLAGKLGNYDLERLVTLAASLEVVHTATLIHDDTIDHALTRRGLDTINAIWDDRVAILTGDFLFAQSAHLAAQLDSVRIMTLLSETVMAMSSGELSQYAASRERSVDESDYLARIGGKTASLFAMCCEGAAVVSGQSSEQIAALRDYGANLGLAFQLADDVLDFTGSAEILGKPAGSDLREGTITLPAILWLRDLPLDSSWREELRAGRNIDAIVRQVAESPAIEQALGRARQSAGAARRSLAVFLPSPARSALLELTDYVVERSR